MQRVAKFLQGHEIFKDNFGGHQPKSLRIPALADRCQLEEATSCCGLQKSCSIEVHEAQCSEFLKKQTF
jgi:hypothetical protein